MRATRLIPVLLLAAGVTASAPAGAQTPDPSEEGAGRLHARLVLEAQSIDVAFTPDLSADDAANRTLLDGTAGTRVRIGTIEGHQALRIGELAPDLEALAETYRAAAAVPAAAPPGGRGGHGGGGPPRRTVTRTNPTRTRTRRTRPRQRPPTLKLKERRKRRPNCGLRAKRTAGAWRWSVTKMTRTARSARSR